MTRILHSFQSVAPRLCAAGLVFLLLPTPADAQMGARISSARDRQAIVDRINEALEMEDEGLTARFVDLRYPFRFVQPERPVTVEAEEQEEEPEEVVPTIPESAILEAIAAKLNPKGTLIRSDRRMIILVGPDGRDVNLREGDEFTATFQEEQYTVSVHTVNTDTFSLRLNESVISRPVFETSDGAVRFHRPDN